MTNRTAVAFDRRIDLEWLDYVAGLAAERLEPSEVRQRLVSFLGDKLAGADRSDSACGKATRLLMRIWVNVDPEVADMRDRALEILPNVETDERLTLHWTLCLAGFPFFGDVAAQVGRLLNLQGTVSTAQMLRRLYEQWGERSTLSFAVQKALRSMVQWRALSDTGNQGILTNRSQQLVVQGDHAKLLLEGLLRYEGKALPVDQAIIHPAFFPFEMSLRTTELRDSARFEVHRQGLDVDVVGIGDVR